jgi:hypothetical protein
MWTITMTQYVITRICATVLFFCNFHPFAAISSMGLEQPAPDQLPTAANWPHETSPRRRPRFVPVYPAHALAAVPPTRPRLNDPNGSRFQNNLANSSLGQALPYRRLYLDCLWLTFLLELWHDSSIFNVKLHCYSDWHRHGIFHGAYLSQKWV